MGQDEPGNAAGKLLRWLMVLGAWVLAAMFVGAHQMLQNLYTNSPVPARQILAWQLVSAVSFFAVTPLICRLAEEFPLERGRFYQNCFIHFTAAVVMVLLLIMAAALVLPVLGYPPHRPLNSFAEAYEFLFLTQFPYNFAVYLAVLGIVFGISFHRKYRERELRALQLETRLVQAQLNVLKVQLRPHFLFNTHNAISELIHKDPRAAERTLAHLSDLLRFTLRNLDVDEISLSHELDFIRKYLAIEQVRFGDRLRVVLEIDPEAHDAAVPTMILQPLIENSIKHGIAPVLAGGTVTVRAEKTGDGRLHLQVSDDGVGFPKDKVLRLKHGVGLSNTRARLLRLYDVFSLDVSRSGAGGLAVSIKIPFRSTAETSYSLNTVAA